MSWLPTLKADTPEEGYQIAIKLSRMAVKMTQPDDEVRGRLRGDYANNADSLTMASRWIQEQNDVELEIAPGGCHMFQFYPELTIAQESLNRIETFANRQIDKAG